MATTKATTLAHLQLGGISSDISTAEINRLDGFLLVIYQTQITFLIMLKHPKHHLRLLDNLSCTKWFWFW